MTDVGLNVSILEFMVETTRMIANMVVSGTKERFSKVNCSGNAQKLFPWLGEPSDAELSEAGVTVGLRQVQIRADASALRLGNNDHLPVSDASTFSRKPLPATI
jgi:hypothetical protein